MGADVHDYAEIRRGGLWHEVGEVFDNPYHKGDDPVRPWEKARTCHPIQLRCYDVFAILADVRNERNEQKVEPRGRLVGCKGDGFVPICRPRGMPGDACPPAVSAAEEYAGDGHSHTWLSLRDLLDYDWSRTTRKELFVDAANYLEWKKDGRPREGFRGGYANVVSHDAMEINVAAGTERDLSTLVEWRQSYASCASLLWDRTIPALVRLIVPDGCFFEALPFLVGCQIGQHGLVVPVFSDWLSRYGFPSLDDVRIVLFFDN